MSLVWHSLVIAGAAAQTRNKLIAELGTIRAEHAKVGIKATLLFSQLSVHLTRLMHSMLSMASRLVFTVANEIEGANG